MSYSLYMKLINIEGRCDNLNSEFGNPKAYCIFCKSNSYNGQVGIIHKKGCAILQMRAKIKELIEINEQN